MEELILNKLNAIAEENNVEILFACESGSRGWGFSSIDSDYDVRFIYRRKVDAYLSVFSEPDEINVPITSELDICGWDIRKVVQLLFKSNVTPFEWLQSPIIYVESFAFRSLMLAALPKYYDAKRHMDHYLGLVRGQLAVADMGNMKLKSFFYSLRSLLSAKWTMEHGHFAPMELNPLLNLLPKELHAKVTALRVIKADVDESHFMTIPEDLALFIQDEYERLASYRCGLKSGTADLRALTDLFQHIIKDDDYS